MDKVTCLNHTFSTTKMLIQEKPRLENKPTDQFDSVLFLPKSSERKGEGGLRTKGYYKSSYENLMFNDECLILNDKDGNEFKVDNSKFKIQNSSLNKLPLISIITVVFNGEKHLEQTIQSVITQSYDNVEYIIIDGGSTDSTLEIIKKYEDRIDYWVSEPDSGIYDAMNKGIRLAGNEWINFMNVGDVFYDNNVLSKVFADLKKYDNVDFIYSDTVFDNKLVYSCDIKENKIVHQSLIYRKKIHQTKGLYLASKGLLISDYLFFMLSKDMHWYKSDVIISNYNTCGLSSQHYSLHYKQKIGTDLLFGNIGIKKAGILLLVHPYYGNLKKMIKNILKFLGLRAG